MSLECGRARGPFKGLAPPTLSYLSCVAYLSGSHLFPRWLGFGSFRLLRTLDLRYLTRIQAPLQYWLSRAITLCLYGLGLFD